MFNKEIWKEQISNERSTLYSHDVESIYKAPTDGITTTSVHVQTSWKMDKKYSNPVASTIRAVAYLGVPPSCKSSEKLLTEKSNFMLKVSGVKYDIWILDNLKAKFHYASWFGASSELAPNMFGTSSEPASVMEFGREPASSCQFAASKLDDRPNFSFEPAAN